MINIDILYIGYIMLVIKKERLKIQNILYLIMVNLFVRKYLFFKGGGGILQK